MMQTLIDRIERLDARVLEGRVTALNGLLIEAEGPQAGLSLGAQGGQEQKSRSYKFRTIHTSLPQMA